MVRIIEIVLILSLTVAVLAFGGTEPLYFSLIQILLLLSGILLVFNPDKVSIDNTRLPVAVPFLLVAFVLVQIVPLPSSLVGLLRSTVELPANLSSGTISIAPYQTLTYFLLLSTYLVGFYLAIVVCQTRRGIWLLVSALLALGAFEAFYGLFQYMTGWNQIFTYVKASDVQEATGTYINRNHFAGLLEMILPFTFALALYQWSKVHPASNRWFSPHQNFQKLVLWITLGVILFSAVIFSRSRMGILSAVASIFVVVALFSDSAMKKRGGALVLVVFLLGGILVAIWIGPETVIARFESLKNVDETMQGQSRWAIWQDTLRLSGRNLLFGSGFGTFPLGYTRGQTVYLNKLVNHAHNDYLEVLFDLGAIGGMLLFGPIFYVVGKAVQASRDIKDPFYRAIAQGSSGSLIAILLHSLTDFNLYIPGNALMFSCVLGIAYSMTKRERMSVSDQEIDVQI